jgi:hypothetical protein
LVPQMGIPRKNLQFVLSAQAARLALDKSTPSCLSLR